MCSMHPMVVSAVLFIAFIPAVDPVKKIKVPLRGTVGVEHIIRLFRDPGFSEELPCAEGQDRWVRGSVLYFEHLAVPMSVLPGYVLVLDSCSGLKASKFGDQNVQRAAEHSFIRDMCPVIPEVTVLENGVSLRARFSVLWSAELVPADYVILAINCQYRMCDTAVSTCSPACQKWTYDFSVKKEL